MFTEPKEANDQSNSESGDESATVKWERFKELAKNVLSLTPEEAERIRKNAPESKDKEQDS